MPVTVLRVPLLSSRRPFNPLTAFTWIIQLTGYLFGVVVRADSPWQSFREFLDAAKSHPGKIVYGTPGAITTPHVVMEQIAAREEIAWVQVPFRGTSENLDALRAGRLDAAADASGWAPLVQDGQLRLLVTAQVPGRQSGQPEARNQLPGIAGQGLEQVPALLPRGREERADHCEVLGTSLGAEAAGDLLPQLHHPPIALHQIVSEGHPRVGQKAEHVMLAHAEAQQEIVANPSRRTATVLGGDCGGDQRGLRRMERQTLSEESVVTSLDAGDQGRLERHAPVAREVGGVAGAAQQALHPARPVLLLDLDQRLEFPQVVRVAQRMQYACQRVVRLPVIMHDDAGNIRQQAAARR